MGSELDQIRTHLLRGLRQSLATDTEHDKPYFASRDVRVLLEQARRILAGQGLHGRKLDRAVGQLRVEIKMEALASPALSTPTRSGAEQAVAQPGALSEMIDAAVEAHRADTALEETKRRNDALQAANDHATREAIQASIVEAMRADGWEVAAMLSSHDLHPERPLSGLSMWEIICREHFKRVQPYPHADHTEAVLARREGIGLLRSGEIVRFDDSHPHGARERSNFPVICEVGHHDLAPLDRIALGINDIAEQPLVQAWRQQLITLGTAVRTGREYSPLTVRTGQDHLEPRFTVGGASFWPELPGH